MKWRQKIVSLPDEGAQVTLNPMERTIYRLFLAHPEGISADDLVLHWKELCDIYAKESCFDDPDIREAKLESLCGESKRVFYSTVSRIKKKFVQALGLWRAEPYVIKRKDTRIYCLSTSLLPTPEIIPTFAKYEKTSHHIPHARRADSLPQRDLGQTQ